MRVLITGALGAIGVWTMRALLERGHEVVAFDVGDDRHRIPIALDADQAAAVAHVRADITDLAAVEGVSTSMRSPPSFTSRLCRCRSCVRIPCSERA